MNFIHIYCIIYIENKKNIVGDIIKKLDILIIAGILIVGLGLLIGLKIYENNSETGNTFAKITYQNELILLIDLNTLDYQIYDTVYKDQVITERSSEGIFYVPGLVTSDMQALYQVDEFAEENQIQGIKLLVEDGKISVVYQESPRDICELQAPTNSQLQPIVCLPNELVIDIYTELSEEFIPDSVLE